MTLTPSCMPGNCRKPWPKPAGPTTPERDVWETLLIEEVFQQRKPLFGICRGHQMLNVALGGTLLVDIPSQVPNALNHNQMARKTEPVHDVTVDAGQFAGRDHRASRPWGQQHPPPGHRPAGRTLARGGAKRRTG